MQKEHKEEGTYSGVVSTWSPISAPLTPEATTNDANLSLRASPPPTRSPGTYSHFQKPPVHPRRASQTSSIKSTSSPPRDSQTSPTPPSPGIASPISSAVTRNTEGSASIPTTYKPYLPYSSTRSKQKATQTLSSKSSSLHPSSSANTPPQPQFASQWTQSLTPSHSAHTSRQHSWRSWATDKLGAASAKVQAGASIVAFSSAAAWKESRDAEREQVREIDRSDNQHQQRQVKTETTAINPSRGMNRRRGSGSKDANMAYNEGSLPTGSRTDVQPHKTTGCATMLSPGGMLETLHVFPGWGVRRYRTDEVEQGSPRPFDIELYISGFAFSSKTPESASRSQKAFVKLAKGFASLPNIPTSAAPFNAAGTSIPLSPTSTISRKRLGETNAGQPVGKVTDSDGNDVVDDEGQVQIQDNLRAFMFHASDSPLDSSHSQHSLLSRLHDNLEKRLLPFLSSVLSNRTVKIGVWLGKRNVAPAHAHSGHHNPEHSLPERFKNTASDEAEEAEMINPPIVQATVTTAADGSFVSRICVPWEELCMHPTGVHLVFGEADHQIEGGARKLQEHEVEVWLDMPLTVRARAGSGTEPLSPNELRPTSGIRAMGHVLQGPLSPLSPTTPTGSPFSSLIQSPSSSSTSPTSTNRYPSILRTHVTVPVTHAPIRLLSDIDDTVKSAGVLSGARAIFHNVFVKELRDIIIPGMGEWYTKMWSMGVRFHYVSNGPYEILPIVNEFFHFAQLPPGSVKLRSYAGRSLFNGLLSAPAARKRQAVIDVLESFKDSKFFLVGDSGEQDLELYSEVARERPNQILAVFVRDVMADNYPQDDTPLPIDDPTGWGVYGVSGVVQGGDDTTLGPSKEDTGTDIAQHPLRSLTASPTAELEDDVGYANAKNLEETPAPDEVLESEFSSSIGLGTPPATDGWEQNGSTKGVTILLNPNHDSRRRRSSYDQNASTAALLNGISVPKPQYPLTRRTSNSKPSARARLKEVLAGSRPGSRSSTKSGSSLIDELPTPTNASMIPALMHAGSGLGIAVGRPGSTAGVPELFVPKDDTDSDGSSASVSTSDDEESASTSSEEWGYSRWRGGKRRLRAKLSRSNASKSSGGSGRNSGSESGSGWGRSTGSRHSTAGSNVSGGGGMSEIEKKRFELQSRVYRARMIMPSSVSLRIFRDPTECVEAAEILKREGVM
ncbi:hypothetical protein CVT24_000710 [Panaeolus cyanescens]|uniref:Phosphatidate phosphatase APP1 catalytic domain-containing protein n=1 Tax=Panaeolus cyanescens TaxID=181874 RepID=A0A409YT41_9AGAR|nr:hypothetical protein CVT24_000710 [Panaeolus cyanescens]